jgi:hypothetical protein
MSEASSRSRQERHGGVPRQERPAATNSVCPLTSPQGR